MSWAAARTGAARAIGGGGQLPATMAQPYMKRVTLSCLACLTALAKPLSVASSRTGLLAENMPQRALFVFIELWKLTLF